MVKIVYEDKSILVCIKPAGMLSEKSENAASLPMLIESEHSGALSLFTVHRLDREVCGVMVYAKSASAAAKLSAQIADRSFEKEYLAIIEGTPEESSATLKDLLFRDAKKNKTYIVNRKRQGVKEASLQYSTLGGSDNTTLLKIILHTGRTHQIRAQFASRKHPIVGDGKYGSKTRGAVIALCSCKIAFKHPNDEEQLCFKYIPEGPMWDIYANILKNG